MDHHALRFLFFLIFSTCSPLPFGFAGVFAQHNVTVNDGDPAIIYLPPDAWNQSAPSSLDASGAHMLTQNPNATATFNFTGIAIYFLSPLWPYTVNTLITLDSGPSTLVDLQDYSRPNTSGGPETVQSHVVWNVTGLANVQHTLRISVGSGQSYAVVDGLIYTDANNVSSSKTSTASSSFATSTNRVAASSKKHVVAVALGTVFGILGLLILLFACWYCWRTGHRPVSEAWTLGAATSTGGSSPTKSRSGGRFIKVLSGVTSKSTKHDSGYDERGSGPAQPGHGYQMRQTAQGDWANPHYGQVGAPPPAISSPPSAQRYRSPQTPAYGYAYQDENGYYHANHPQPYYQPPPPAVDPHTRAPNRYEPGNTLSTITEKSTPQVPGSGGTGSRPLPPTSPESRTSPELGHPNAPVGPQQHEGWGQNASPGQAGWSVIQQQQQQQSSPQVGLQSQYARPTQALHQGRGPGGVEQRVNPPSNGANPTRAFAQRKTPERWI